MNILKNETNLNVLNKLNYTTFAFNNNSNINNFTIVNKKINSNRSNDIKNSSIYKHNVNISVNASNTVNNTNNRRLFRKHRIKVRQQTGLHHTNDDEIYNKFDNSNSQFSSGGDMQLKHHELEVVDPNETRLYVTLLIICFITIFIGKRLYNFLKLSKYLSNKRISDVDNKKKSMSPYRMGKRKTVDIELSSMNMYDSDSVLYDIQLQGRLATGLLDLSMTRQIIPHLPSSLRGKDWSLIYASARDGWSLNTFQMKVYNRGPTILLLKDHTQYIFGAFINESWHETSGYFGNGETFVFRLKPEFHIYRWSMGNAYFAQITDTGLSIGGGNNFAIWLDDKLQKGSSKTCQTFNNPQLSGISEFELYEMEVWCFMDPF